MAVPAGPDEGWDRLLAELETRVEQWQVALDGDGPYPDDFHWPQDLGPCPGHLADRARRVNAAQRDLQSRLALRRESLGALLRSDAGFGRASSVALFVDQRM